MNTSHENKQLRIWSNLSWLIQKKHWNWCFHFSYHLVFHIFRQIWSAPLINIAAKRYSSHVGLNIVFQEVVSLFPTNRFHKRFFPMVWVFCLAISSATSYDACLLGRNMRQGKSLTFQTCFMASEEFYNFLWRDWNALSLNVVSISNSSYTFHWQALCHCNTLLPECWLQPHNSQLLVGYLSQQLV